MLSPSLVILFRLIHVVVGVCWAGAVVFLGFIFLPTARTVGPAADPLMAPLMKTVPKYMMALVILTVVSGVVLFWHDSFGFKSDAWMHSGPGRAFSIGGTLGIIVAIMGMVVNTPTAKKLGALGSAVRASGSPPSAAQAAEMERLQKRLGTATSVGAVLLLLAASAMAVARYIPS